MNRYHTPGTTERRVVRVFVSSTFRDMHAEREELIKRTFPQLRKLCEERGVAWGEVDLRWGVTDEQKAEGKVLPVCLAEIQRCRPYFIGLLGERYGSIPDNISQDLIEREPWLTDNAGHSVTELEILHGVLNNPAMADRALFYFRDSSFINSLPKEQQSDFLELATTDEIERLGQAEAERRTEDRRQKLLALKDRIRQSCLPVRENYPNPKTLGEMVLRDLTEVINRLYQPKQLDPLDRDSLDHEAFAHGRARVYISRQEYFDRLDQHVQDDGPPLVILGESGAGKSSLLANWALRFAQSHSEEALLMHFIGATPYSADWALMLRRLMGEFKRKFDIQQEISEQPDALRTAFANWLHLVAAKGRVVLILDALGQLEDRDGAPDLLWLPLAIPPNIRLIVSTLPGRPLDDLNQRGWPQLQVEPLERPERKQLITNYLAQYTKALNPEHVQRIIDADQTANPLYLTALLEELRLYGDHTTLDQRITHYLMATTVSELYEKILQRYEEDYDRERPGLVRDTMSLLWVARRGLSEAELIDLLSTAYGPLPRAYWSPLYLAAEASLVSVGGLIGFAYEHLRHAVRNRYLPTGEHQKAMRLRLADYFGRVSMEIAPAPKHPDDHYTVEVRTEYSLRMQEEWCWQLWKAEQWERLLTALSHVAFFVRLFTNREYDALTYWSDLLARDPDAIRIAYRDLLEHPETCDEKDALTITNLFYRTGHLDEAQRLASHFVSLFQEHPDYRLACFLHFQATVLETKGDLQSALTLNQQAGSILRQIGKTGALAESLMGQANVLLAQGDRDSAIALYKEVETIARETGQSTLLATVLNNQATILLSSGAIDEAMALYSDQERTFREHDDLHLLASCLGGQANVLAAKEDFDGAMERLQEVEHIARQLGDPVMLAATLGNQGTILWAREQPDAAMGLFKEQERVSEKTGNLKELAIALNNQAAICMEREEQDAALALLKRKEQICREMGNPLLLASTLQNQAVILKDRGDMQTAIGLLGEVEHIGRKLEDPNIVAHSLAAQAQILEAQGNATAALALWEEEAGLRRRLQNPSWLNASLNQQTALYARQGDMRKVMELLEEKERLTLQTKNPKEEYVALQGQVALLHSQGDLEGALQILKRQQQLCVELADQGKLAACLDIQGVILKDQGDLDGAMVLLKEEEKIWRELGDRAGLQGSLGNQAIVIKARGDLDSAMALLKEQEQIARELNNHVELATCLTNQASILHRRGDTQTALQLISEAERTFRDVNHWRHLPGCLMNHARILVESDRPEEALPLIDEAAELINRYGLQPMIPYLQAVRRDALRKQFPHLENEIDWDRARSRLDQLEIQYREQGNIFALAIIEQWQEFLDQGMLGEGHYHAIMSPDFPFNR